MRKPLVGAFGTRGTTRAIAAPSSSAAVGKVDIAAAPQWPIGLMIKAGVAVWVVAIVAAIFWPNLG